MQMCYLFEKIGEIIRNVLLRCQSLTPRERGKYEYGAANKRQRGIKGYYWLFERE